MNNCKILKMLINSSYPMDLITNLGRTALFLASSKGHLKAVKTLVKAGADVNKVDDSGIGPLYIAILNENYDTAEYLINEGG
jgi:ankyrin repeat protein